MSFKPDFNTVYCTEELIDVLINNRFCSACDCLVETDLTKHIGPDHHIWHLKDTNSIVTLFVHFIEVKIICLNNEFSNCCHECKNETQCGETVDLPMDVYRECDFHISIAGLFKNQLQLLKTDLQTLKTHIAKDGNVQIFLLCNIELELNGLHTEYMYNLPSIQQSKGLNIPTKEDKETCRSNSHMQETNITKIQRKDRQIVRLFKELFTLKNTKNREKKRYDALLLEKENLLDLEISKRELKLQEKKIEVTELRKRYDYLLNIRLKTLLSEKLCNIQDKTALKQQIQLCQDEKEARMADILDKTGRSIDHLKSENEKLTKQLGKTLEEVEDLRAKYERLKRGNSDMRRELKDVERTNYELKFKIESSENDNKGLRSKLIDLKIQFKEWTELSTRMAKTLNSKTPRELEKESTMIEEDMYKTEKEKQRLEQELSETLDKITISKEDCQSRSRKYEKCHQDEVENNYYDSTRIQGDDTEEDRNQTPGDEKQLCVRNQTKTLVASSNNDSRHITSDNRIFHITAKTVHVIDKSRVSLDSSTDHCSLDSNESNLQLELED